MSHKYKVLVPAMLLAALLMLSGCAKQPEEAPAPSPEQTVEPAETIAPTPAPTPVPTPKPEIIVNEFMEKNKSLIPDEDGEFSDWIELYNAGDEPVSLKGWRITDDLEQKGWKFPNVTIDAGEYLLVFASNKEKDTSDELHADFAISGDEGVYLKDAHGELIFEVSCGGCSGDVAMARDESGNFAETLRATPGFENSDDGYIAFQQSLEARGPLVISEVMSYDDSVLYAGERGYCDWVEIKNISSETVQLSDYWLSDDDDDYMRFRLPRWDLAPGQTYIVVCDDTEGSFAEIYPCSGFALSSDGEALYLTDEKGALSDHCTLPAIPYGCSYGRSDKENGWFYYAKPSPLENNKDGQRLIAEQPRSLTKDGIYEGVVSVDVELSGSGTIRYTLDGSMPTEKSKEYNGPISISETSVLRAASFKEGYLPSRALTQSFIINEGHTLPVLSLATDSPLGFKQMYDGMQKGVEKSGALSLYRENDSFTIGCGVSLNGETSLVLPKKNMSVRFRGAYGQAELEHDIYGGGVTEFTNLLLRSGQDYEYAIIRNELSQGLCELAGMKVINQRSIWCVLYINGEYSGIYTLKEKANEQLYASIADVKRSSVTAYEATVPYGTDFYSDVVSFLNKNDMSLPENYEQFCSVMDVDSLIDWLIIQGFCSNPDLSSGNLRYAKSTENDGKWRLMFYDLDASFRDMGGMYYNLLTEYGSNNYQVGAIAYALMKNEQFCDRFLTRAAELFETVLTNETILSEIDRHAAIIAPEVARDYGRYTMTVEEWEWDLNNLRDMITDYNWRQCCIDALCEVFELSSDERAHYFGEIDGK